MSTRVILMILFLAALFLLALIILLERKRKGEPEESGYIKALYSLIEGNRLQAVAYLKGAVKNGERDVGAYILLGDLLREEGKAQKALQIHRNMSVRRDLSDDDRRKIQLAISRDLIALDRNEEGISTLENIRKWKNYPDIVFALHRFYHLNRDYSKAHRMLNRYVKLTDANGDEIVISYLASIAGGLIEKGEYESGAAFAEKALGIKPDFNPALYNAGLAYYRSEEIDRAIDKWLALLNNDITYLSLTLRYIQMMLFEKKDFGRLENILNDLYEKNKGNPDLFRAIATFYERKGETTRIIDYYEGEINQIEPDEKLIIKMAGIFLEEGHTDKAKRILGKLDESSLPVRTFKCSDCGADSVADLPYCGECGSMNSYQEYYEKSYS